MTPSHFVSLTLVLESTWQYLLLTNCLPITLCSYEVILHVPYVFDMLN